MTFRSAVALMSSTTVFTSQPTGETICERDINPVYHPIVRVVLRELLLLLCAEQNKDNLGHNGMINLE